MGITGKVHSIERLKRCAGDIRFGYLDEMLHKNRPPGLLPVRTEGRAGICSLIIFDDKRHQRGVSWEAEFGVDLWGP